MTTKKKINKKRLLFLIFSGVCGVTSIFFLFNSIYIIFNGKIDSLVINFCTGFITFIISGAILDDLLGGRI